MAEVGVRSSGLSSDLWSAALGAGLVLAAGHAQAQQTNPDIVIRQVYGGGGNSGAPYTNDFVELFNRGAAPVSIAGWSVQYASATGTGSFGANANLITPLPAAVLQPGQSFLVQEAGGATGAPLPAADVSGTIAMSASTGKVALVASTSGLGCNSASNCSGAALAQIIDLVGYGTANFFEGTAAAATLGNNIAAQRAAGGCTDTNNNANDLAATTPTPRNSGSPLAACGGTAAGSVGACGDPATSIGAIQGTGPSSPLLAATVNVEGVVVGDFQDDGIHGFFIQTPDANVDGDPNTADGLFVFAPASTVAVVPGDSVRVRGTVAESQTLTELTSVSDVLVCPRTALVSAQTLKFPVASVADLERYEGMLVQIDQTLTVTGNFQLGRFGSLDLSASG
jgi:predicted extracellular nuclease